MHRLKNFLSLFFVFTLILMMSVSSLAANTSNTSFTNFVVDTNNEYRIPPREKMDYSSHYFTYTGGPVTLSVVSYGTRVNTTIGGTNVTCSNGQAVTYVACRRGTQYNVHNFVKEQGYSWASLGLTSFTEYGEISGVWSPDSYGTYISARP